MQDFYRYRSEELCRHWSANVNGFCQTGSCTNTVESIEHILITCSTYYVTRDRLKMLWLTSSDPVIRDIASKALSGPPKLLLQFLLDCSVIPTVISAAQCYGQGAFQSLFYLTRTWCFSLYRERMKALNRWNFR